MALDRWLPGWNRFQPGDLFLSTFISIACFAAVAHSGQIQISDFSPGAVVQDFESLGTGSGFLPNPFVIAGDTYTANDDGLDFSSKLGPAIGRSGVAIGHRVSISSNVEFIQITLGTPSLRAGFYVGSQAPWQASINFYDIADNIVGTIPLGDLGRDSIFAGWQSEILSIAKIRVHNLTSEGHRLIIDDFIREIPEPISIQLLIASIMSISILSRRKHGHSFTYGNTVGKKGSPLHEVF